VLGLKALLLASGLLIAASGSGRGFVSHASGPVMADVVHLDRLDCRAGDEASRSRPTPLAALPPGPVRLAPSSSRPLYAAPLRPVTDAGGIPSSPRDPPSGA